MPIRGPLRGHDEPLSGGAGDGTGRADEVTASVEARGIRPATTGKGEARAQQLLDAGLVAAASRPAAETLPSRAETLRATETDGRALGPASTGSFRHAFGSLEEFHRRLVEERLLAVHPAEPETADRLDGAAKAIESGAVTNAAFLLGRMARLDLEAHLCQPQEAQRRIFALAAALAPGEPAAAKAVRNDARRVTSNFAALHQQVLDAWGMRFRAPFDSQTAATLFSALVDGILVRGLVDPASVDLDDYENTVVGLMVLMVARPEDERSIGELIRAAFPRPRPPNGP